jgi:phosphatidylglycerophosphate synthase
VRDLGTNLALLPNQITAIRIILLPFMWWAALDKNTTLLGAMIVIALASDAVDGWIARRLGQVSDFGAAFDSLADNLLLPSAAIWLAVLRPEILEENFLPTLTALAAYVASIVVGVARFRRFGGVHHSVSRLSGVALYVFAIHALVSETYSPVLFWVALVAFVVSSLTTLVVQLQRRPLAATAPQPMPPQP